MIWLSYHCRAGCASGHLLGSIPRIEGATSPTDPLGSAWGDVPVSATMANLLPSASPALARPSGGVYMGKGISPVPARLAERICRGEYVDMGELLPEFWSGQKDETMREARSCRTCKVADIFTWLQSFGSYVVVRASGAPELVPELMAYQATIIRVSQDFAGLAWVRYDQAYRRQAALTGHTRWSVINATLYTMCFTGMATVQKRCELCLATSHTEQECAQAGDVDPGLKERLKMIEAAMVALVKEERSVPSPGRQLQKLEACRKWNGSGCSFPRCRYSHSCSICGGDHPASKCSARPTQGIRGQSKPGAPSRPY